MKRLSVCLGLLTVVLCAPVARAAFDPSDEEQLLLEWTNRMRMSPADELGILLDSIDPIHSPDPDVQAALNYFGTDGSVLADQWDDLVPAPPLAWSPELHDAALGHNQAMIDADEQSHQVPGEPSLPDRVEAAGYTNWSRLGENVFAFSESVFHAHSGFAIDWGDDDGDPNNGFGTGIQDPPGHRINLMNADLREVGISIVEETDPMTSVGPLLVTQDFGNRFDLGDPWLLGVVYDDADADSAYGLGEGLGGVTVLATGAGGDSSTTSLSAGGFQIQVPDGTYELLAYGPGIDGAALLAGIVISGENAKADFAADDATFLPGDATLDGQVDAADLSLLAASWQSASGETWRTADFNGDGATNAADLSLLAANWQAGAGVPAPLSVGIPEPTALLLLAGGAVSLLRRRH